MGISTGRSEDMRSPKSVFEEAYKLSETFLDRMKVEFDVEFAKWDKGDTFIRSKKFNELPLISRVLLYAQNKTQKQFCDLLESRIDVANNNDLMLYAFNFSTAISLLKAGAAVRREDWKNSNAFVVKQIPSHINEDIIPKMQSLPQSAKDILMARKHPEIKYRNQLLIIGEDGIADSWHPTPDDIFAEDWMIVTDEC